MKTSDLLFMSPEVAFALSQHHRVVALESTVISHGLPYPNNLETALTLESIVRENGAIPATIAVLEGVPHIGLSEKQIRLLAQAKDVRKLSRRDLPIALGQKLNGATTVATTTFFAHAAGIKVFATGGIGGVHRGSLPDVSADLPELARTPITVVCAGAKAILDLPATREWLETHGIPVIGWQTDEMPAFYSQSSNLPVDARVENAKEAAEIIRARDNLQLENAILITAPVPAANQIPARKVEAILQIALIEAANQKIAGKDLTPFLLKTMAEKSRGETLAANLSLLENNARIAAQIAAKLH